jgi:hypothetical protein
MTTTVEKLRHMLQIEELVEFGNPLGIDEKWLRDAAERNLDQAYGHVLECAEVHELYQNAQSFGGWPAIEDFVKTDQMPLAHARQVHLWGLLDEAKKLGVLEEVRAAISRNDVNAAESINTTRSHSLELARVVSFCQMRLELLPESGRPLAVAVFDKIKQEKYGSLAFGTALLEFERVTRL